MRLTGYIAALSLIAISCGPAPVDPAETDASPSSQAASSPEDAELNLDAVVTGDAKVQFTVTTTLPLPVEIMADVNLANQEDDDIYIGFGKKVTLDKPEMVFTLDGSDEDTLPTGDYEAEVAFYPNWGAENGNPEAARAPELTATVPIRIKGNGTDPTTIEQANRKNEMQQWVMSSVGMNEPWDRARFEGKLGRCEKGPSTLSKLHDAYYCSEADVTLIVNRVRNEMTIWRLGRATQ